MWSDHSLNIILDKTTINNLAEIFFDFNSEISQKRYNTKEAKKEGLERRANPIKKPKLKSPKDDVTPKRIKKRPMRRLKPKKSS